MRERQPARLPHEQRMAEVRFETGDLTAHRALRHIEHIGRAREIELLRDHQKGFEDVEGRQRFHRIEP